jgi:hypothetical protein
MSALNDAYNAMVNYQGVGESGMASMDSGHWRFTILNAVIILLENALGQSLGSDTPDPAAGTAAVSDAVTFTTTT